MSRIGFIGLLLLPFLGCQDDKPADPADPTVTLQIKVVYEDQDFEVGEVYYDGLGHRIRVENFMTYLSMISLSRPDGTTEVIKDFALCDLDLNHSFTAQIPAGDYNEISFDLGIPENYNKDVDPTSYPNSHPLSVQGSQGMFWHWNTGYIFTKFDGKADLTGTEGSSIIDPFAFHCGDDPLLRKVFFPLTDTGFELDEKRTIVVELHVEQILNGVDDQIDISVDYLTHTNGNFELAERFMNNYRKAFSLVN